MTHLRYLTFCLFALGSVLSAQGQTKSVIKNITGNTITESLTIGSGKTLTIASGATIIAAPGSTVTGFGSGGASALDDLSDVTINTLTANQLLRYNGTAWVNWTPDFLTEGTAESTYQPKDDTLTALSGLPTQSFGLDLLNLGLAEEARTQFELGTENDVTFASVTATAFIGDGSDITDILGANLIDGSVANAKLANSTITIGGASTALGGTVTATTILDSISTTRGTLLYRNATSWVALAPGTSGHFLKSNGAGADPSYAAVSASPGGASGDVQYNNAGSFGGVSGITLSSGTLTGLTITGGTITTSTPLITGTQTWNAGAQIFHADSLNITNTTSAAASTVLRRQVGGSDVFSIARNTVGGNEASEWRLVLGADVSLGYAPAWGAATLRNAANSAYVNLRADSIYAAAASTAQNHISAGSGSEGEAQLSGAGWRGAGLRMRNSGTITVTTGNDVTSSTAFLIDFGTASPEASVTASPGSMYLRENSGAGELWIKTSGTGDTGWQQVTIP